MQYHYFLENWWGNSDRLSFLGLQKSLQMVTEAMKLRLLLLGRRAVIKFDSILKSRDTTLLTKVHIVRVIVFPGVMYGCESWTIKKAGHQRIDAFDLWCWRRLLRVLWIVRRSYIHTWLLEKPDPDLFWQSNAELHSPISVHFSSLIPKMSTFTLAICCLMTSVLPWSMDLTFWFLCNIVYYIIGLYTFTTRHIHNCVLFLLFLSLFIPSGPISLLFSSSILGTYQLGEFIFQCHIFLPFHIVHGILKQACQSGLPLSSSVDHVLSELSTMTLPFWVALSGMVLSFLELGRGYYPCDQFGGFLWFWFSFCLPSDGWGWGLWSSLMGVTGFWQNGSCSGGQAMLSKSLIQFSVDGWGCVPSP